MGSVKNNVIMENNQHRSSYCNGSKRNQTDGKVEGKMYVSNLVYHILDISQQIQMLENVIWDQSSRWTNINAASKKC